MLFALALLAAAPAPTETPPWEGSDLSADPAVVRAAADALKPPADATADVLYDATWVRFDEQGRAHTRMKLVFRPLTRAAAESWARLQLPFSPWREAKPEVQARVIAPDGAVRRLDPNTLVDAPAGDEETDVYGDRRSISGPLPALSANGIVEEIFDYQQTLPLFEAGVRDVMGLSRGVPIRHETIVFVVPASIPFRHQLLGTAVKATERVEGGLRTIVYDLRDVPAFEPLESWRPPASSGPHVVYGTARSWQAVARAYSEAVDKKIAAADVSAQVAEALAGMKPGATDAERAAALLAWLRKNVRYTGVELGDASIIPREPGDTLTRRYGDCKDMATLLVALLRSAKISASVALLSPGDSDEPPDVPGFGGFSHAVVFLPGRTPLWVDPTWSWGAVGELAPNCWSRQALVAAPATTGLTRTPPPTVAHFTERLTFSVAESGGGVVRAERAQGGVLGANDREAARELSADKFEERDARWLKIAFGGVPTAIQHSDPDDLARPFTENAEIKDTTRAWTSGDSATVQIGNRAFFEELPDAFQFLDDDDAESKHKPRKAPLINPWPFTAEISVVAVPPVGFTAAAVPPAQTRKLGPFTYHREFSVRPDGAVVGTLTFDATAQKLEAAEVEAARTAIRELVREGFVLIRFDETAAALIAAGKVKEALDQYRRLCALHPTEANHPLRLSLALARLGAVDAAEQAARQGVQLEPKDFYGHSVLGWVLEHDAFGRYFHKGWRYDEALAELKKAKELAPKNAVVRHDVAVLLSYAPDGHRYGEGARIAEAAAELKALKADLNESKYDVELLGALAESEQWAEAKKLAPTVAPSAERDMLWLAAIAATDGAAAAIGEAAQQIADASARRKALATAAGLLMRHRRYDEMRALFSELTPNFASDPQMRVLVKLKRTDEVKLDRRDPAAAVVAMVVDAFSGADEKAVAADLTLGAARAFDVRGVGRLGAANLTQYGLSLKAARDSALASMEGKILDGSDKDGYRVEMKTLGVNITSELYVVKEKGVCKVAAPLDDGPSVGLTALELLKRRDVPNARRVLEGYKSAIAMRRAATPSPLNALIAEVLTPEAEAARLELAAQLLAMRGPDAIAAEDAVEKKRASLDSPLAKKVDDALFWALADSKRYDDAARVLERWKGEGADSDEVWVRRALLGQMALRLGEVKALASKRLDGAPNDPVAVEWAFNAASRGAEWKDAEDYGRQLISLGRANPNIYNNLAWARLFGPAPYDEALEWAQLSVNAKPTATDAHRLHTVASVLAEMDRPVEAHAKLRQAVDLLNPDEIPPYVWYTYGRIAEGYGLPEVARAAYAKVTLKPGAAADDSYYLAERRRKAMPALVAGDQPP